MPKVRGKDEGPRGFYSFDEKAAAFCWDSTVAGEARFAKIGATYTFKGSPDRFMILLGFADPEEKTENVNAQTRVFCRIGKNGNKGTVRTMAIVNIFRNYEGFEVVKKAKPSIPGMFTKENAKDFGAIGGKMRAGHFQKVLSETKIQHETVMKELIRLSALMGLFGKRLALVMDGLGVKDGL